MPQIRGDHSDGISEEIAKLAALRDTGVLTEKEFQSQKRALLRANQSRLGMVGQSFPTRTRLAAIGAVIAIIVALAVIRPGSSPSKPIQISETATNAPAKATSDEIAAVTWADTQANNHSTAFGTQQDGLCLTFVVDAYLDGASAHIEPLTKLHSFTGNTYPQEVWDNGNGFIGGTTGIAPSTPPYGALVFFDASGPGASDPSDFSHVTIMGASGEMVSSPDVVNKPSNDVHYESMTQVLTAKPWNTYVGWWLPDGASAPPPPTTTTPTSTPGSGATPAASPSSTTKASSATPSTGGRTSPTPTTSPTVAPTQTPPPPPVTHSETAGGVAHTWTDYANAGGNEGPSIAAYQTVQIACKVTGFAVADGNTWWYRIASSPWNNAYYVSADAFYNNGSTSGPLKGTPFVDPNVPNC